MATAGGLAFGTQAGTGAFDDSYARLSGFPPDLLGNFRTRGEFGEEELPSRLQSLPGRPQEGSVVGDEV